LCYKDRRCSPGSSTQPARLECFNRVGVPLWCASPRQPMSTHEPSGPVAISMTDLINDDTTPVETERKRSAVSPPTPIPRVMGVATATLLVVASMVGTGVFTTTGLLLADIS